MRLNRNSIFWVVLAVVIIMVILLCGFILTDYQTAVIRMSYIFLFNVIVGFAILSMVSKEKTVKYNLSFIILGLFFIFMGAKFFSLFFIQPESGIYVFRDQEHKDMIINAKTLVLFVFQFILVVASVVGAIVIVVKEFRKKEAPKQ